MPYNQRLYPPNPFPDELAAAARYVKKVAMAANPSDANTLFGPFHYPLEHLPQVLAAGVFHNPPGTEWPLLNIDFLSANYVTCGSARCLTNDRPLNFQAGHVYLWKPGDRFHGTVDEQLTSLYVRFRWPGWTATTRQGTEILDLPKSIPLSPSAQRDVQSTYDLLIEQYLAQRPGWELSCGGYVQVLLGLFQRAASGKEAPDGAKANHALDRRLGLALAYMESHLHERPGVAQLAEAARLSEDYFRRLFRKRLGVSPVQYLNRLRVSAARRLIAREPGLTVTEVGHRVGFQDVRYFARTFRQAYRLTPDEYRRSLDSTAKEGF
jgi:AraC-like DNA-binding protein